MPSYQMIKGDFSGEAGSELDSGEDDSLRLV